MKCGEWIINLSNDSAVVSSAEVRQCRKQSFPRKFMSSGIVQMFCQL